MTSNPPRESAPSSGSLARRTESLVDGEFVLTADDFRKISGIIHAHAGIALAETKAALVYSRLARRLRLLGLESFKDYCALVGGKDGLDERQSMLTALTTNVTKFFREPHHFDHLRDKVMPRLAETARRGGRVRLWSAACSSGQEPYSIAITVLAALPEAPNLDVKILATDIDPRILDEAREGAYSDDALQPVPPNLRGTWFKRVSMGPRPWRVCDDLRSLVSFRELNLIGDWPMSGSFDVIFCRNVVIYFDEATQEQVWSRFIPKMQPGATLCIGHSERVTGPAAGQLNSVGLTTYVLGGGR
jgi:chemotaxis protein methyltransferase CheR